MVKGRYTLIVAVAGSISIGAAYHYYASNQSVDTNTLGKNSSSTSYQREETTEGQLSDVLSKLEETRMLVENYKNDIDIEISEIRQSTRENAKNDGSSEVESGASETDGLEEQQQIELALIEENEAYDNEIVDFSWAPEAESNIDDGLSQLKENVDFEIIGSECKTNRCVATVQFQNYESAVENGNLFAEMSFPGLNCAQSTYLPEPNDVSASYQADLMLDCSQQNQGLVTPID